MAEEVRHLSAGTRDEASALRGKPSDGVGIVDGSNGPRSDHGRHCGLNCNVAGMKMKIVRTGINLWAAAPIKLEASVRNLEKLETRHTMPREERR